MRRSHGRAVFIMFIGLAMVGMLAFTILSTPPVAAAASDSCPADATILSL